MTEPRPIVIKFTAAPYSYKVWICFGIRAQGQRWLRRHFKITEDISDAEGYAGIDDERLIAWAWIHTDADESTIVHEAVHLGTRILRDSGVPITAANDEAAAYLIGHMYAIVVEKRRRALARRARRNFDYY